MPKDFDPTSPLRRAIFVYGESYGLVHWPTALRISLLHYRDADLSHVLDFPTNTMKAANGIYHSACSLQLVSKTICVLYSLYLGLLHTSSSKVISS